MNFFLTDEKSIKFVKLVGISIGRYRLASHCCEKENAKLN